MFTIIGADQKEYGPASADEIRDWIKQGRADGRTIARVDGGEWKPLSAFPEFAGYTAASGAPPRMPAAPASPAQAEEPVAVVIGADPDFDFGDCIRRGWDLLTDNFGLLVGGSALIWLLDLVVQYIPLAGIFLGGALYGGLYMLFLKCIRRQPAQVTDVFAGFSSSFVQLVLTGFLTALLTSLAGCCFLLPAIYLKIAWAFAVALVIDKRLEFWTAMELSRTVVTRVWLKVFALTLVVFAPFLILFCIVQVKMAILTYPVTSEIFASGVPDFHKWMTAIEEVAAKVQFLQLAAQLVLLVNLPFAVGALMYAYEALFALGPRKPLSRQMAWGCFTTNLAFPGFGSLLAGRVIGYFQVPFTICGLGLTIICGIPAFIWGLSNYARIQQDQDDPFAALSEIWVHFRWSILGMALFFFGLLWALATSLSIMYAARAAEKKSPRPLPPVM